jgi:Protein of unknown function (DUF3999)
MKHLVSLFMGLVLGSTVAQAEALVPQDFAFGLAVTTTQVAAAYRFPLPLVVYQTSFRGDLGDLRMFNARGAAVPFSLSRPTALAQSHQPATALPMFPLREGSHVVIDGIHVTIDSPHSAINLQTNNGSTVATTVNQYILDARTLDTAVSALVLGWSEAAADYSGRVRIEASDDLGSWRTVVAAAPIANLHANGQALTENRIVLTTTAAKYWRLTWLGSPPAFELTSAQAEPTDSIVEPVRSALEVLGKPDPANATDYLFDLGAWPPVSRINVLLPEANTIVDVELSSRRSSKGPWHYVIRAAFYRLKTPDAESQNASLEIAVNADRYWRARISRNPIPPQTPLHLHVEWVPNELTFLAQGQGPFLLAYGNATAVNAEADFSHIPSSTQIAPAIAGSPQLLGGPDRLRAKPAAFPWMRGVLWSVLVLAVMILAWMAYRISRDSTPSAEPHEGA